MRGAVRRTRVTPVRYVGVVRVSGRYIEIVCVGGAEPSILIYDKLPHNYHLLFGWHIIFCFLFYTLYIIHKLFKR